MSGAIALARARQKRRAGSVRQLAKLGRQFAGHDARDVEDREAYIPHDWRYAERWPPPDARPHRLYLRGDGSLAADGPGGPPRG